MGLLHRLSILTFLHVTTLCPASALSAWRGQKVIHSITSDQVYYIRVDIQSEDTGVLISPLGEGQFSYQEEEGGVLNLTLKDSLSISSRINTVNRDQCSEQGSYEDCEAHNLVLTDTLKSIQLNWASRQVKVIETWERCRQVTPNLFQREKRECRTVEERFEGLYIADRVQGLEMDLKGGDQVVLPVPGASSAFLQLNEDHSVTVLDREWSEFRDKFNSRNIQRWVYRNRRLIFSLRGGGQITYIKTQEYEGVWRVVADYHKFRDSKTFSAAMVVDRGVGLADATSDEVAGHYKTIHVETISSTYHNSAYVFYGDGTGGTQFYDGIHVELQETPWLWTLEENVLITEHYSYLPQFGGIRINDLPTIKSCKATIRVKPLCYLESKNYYRLLAQDGSRYILLRSTDQFEPKGKESSVRNLSIWVFYRK